MRYNVLLEQDRRDPSQPVSYYKIIGKVWSKKKLPKFIIKTLRIYNILTREFERESVVITLEKWDKDRKVIRANIDGIHRQ